METPTLVGFGAGFSRHAHKAAVTLNDQVICRLCPVGSRMAESCDRGENKLRVDGINPFLRNAKPIQDAGPEIIHHDVRILQQF